MKIKILDIFEEGDNLRVKTECDYGIDDLGLSLDKLKFDLSGIPKWQIEVKKLLEAKYKNAKPIKKQSLESFKNKTIDLDKI